MRSDGCKRTNSKSCDLRVNPKRHGGESSHPNCRPARRQTAVVHRGDFAPRSQGTDSRAAKTNPVSCSAPFYSRMRRSGPLTHETNLILRKKKNAVIPPHKESATHVFLQSAPRDYFEYVAICISSHHQNTVVADICAVN
jgi:hypothetical protein